MNESMEAFPEDDPPGPTVERLAVEEVPTKPRPQRRIPGHLRLFDAAQPAQEPVQTASVAAPPPAPSPQADRSVVAFEVFRALGQLLAARALIFVFGMCGFAIAFVAALRESREVLFVFVAWTVLTVIPLIALDIVARRRE